MPEATRACFSLSLKPSEELRWRRRCQRKDVRHTSAVRDLVLTKLNEEKEPEIPDGTNVKKELAKFTK